MPLIQCVCMMNLPELNSLADGFRLQILEMIHRAGFGYTGRSLAYVDLLTVLYFGNLNRRPLFNYDSSRPLWEQRDYLLLSCPKVVTAFYACLARARFFDERLLESFGQFGGLLPNGISSEVPGVEKTIQASGEGLRHAHELARELFSHKKSNLVYVLLDDDDLINGSTWEAAMDIAYERLGHVVALGVHTGLAKLQPVADKFQAFGWRIIKALDGQDHEQILFALLKAKEDHRRPTFVFLPSLLGKGVPFAEGKDYYADTAFSSFEVEEAKRFLSSIV
ncbi:MAG: hypothetical protein ACD_28C00108G0002 [uncultured bacterium]|nr:MAG: hypothetical protein ACD_28C00108G0002 [uncultured bacterium]KKT76102.1 MAG: Transketolase [Candidatus Peregrinibacteria bacterium GW2011_GWA2_44_7]